MPVFDNPDRPDRSAHPEPVVLRIGSRSDLLAAVAACLGFHPTNSAVALAMDGDRIILAVRIDLPAATADPAFVTAAAGEVLLQVVRRGATAVALVGYGPTETVNPLLADMMHLLDGDPVRVVDVLRVTDGRYFDYLRPGDGCSPRDGVPFDPATSVVTAQTVLAGMVVLPNRAAVADSIAAVSGTHLDRMRQAMNAAAQQVTDTVQRDGLRVAARAGSDTVAAALTRYREGGHLDDDEMARLLVHLVHDDVRADAWRATDAEPWQEDLWRDATRRATSPVVAAPASLLAFTAWRRGNGALARIAVQRALAGDARFPMALIMREVLAQGLPPSQFPGWAALGDGDAD